MREIETKEQREKALEWMVKTADELAHPLLPENEKTKKLKVYDYVSSQVQAYNNKLFEGIEYPPVEEEQKHQIDVSSWLDD